MYLIHYLVKHKSIELICFEQYIHIRGHLLWNSDFFFIQQHLSYRVHFRGIPPLLHRNGNNSCTTRIKYGAQYLAKTACGICGDNRPCEKSVNDKNVGCCMYLTVIIYSVGRDKWNKKKTGHFFFLVLSRSRRTLYWLYQPLVIFLFLF